MSASEASLRRKVVTVIEKKSPAGLIPESRTNGVAGDVAIRTENDFSHTMKGETLVERSKDKAKLRKSSAPPASISPRRKKSVPSPGKRKWETVLSVLAKNCVLLSLILWFGKMVWTSTDRIQDPTNSPFMGLEYEGRVSEVAASLKETATMFQLQLEVLDRKIGSGFENVRKEVSENVGKKRELFEKDLKILEARVDSLDESFGGLKDMGLVSREEFENFWNEMKNSRSLERGDQDANLDKIRAFARSIVEKEIEKHAADGLGRADYALASAGAAVVMHSQAYSFGKLESWSASFKSLSGVHPNARKMLEPSFGEPGQCFALEGSSGYVQIKLKTIIIPQAVTLEHVSKSVAYDRSSAPKEGKVFGCFKEPTDDLSRPPTWFLVAIFSYDLEKGNIQTFNVDPDDIVGAINMVRLDIDSNHGSSALTCIYRLRVHGYEPSSPAAMGMMESR